MAAFKDNDIREILNYLKKRISGHYSGLAKAPRASSYFSADTKRTLDTVCDISVSDRYKPKQYKERPRIKLCRRYGENVHAFRVELKPDFSDIDGNNNLNYNVNYLAFAVENITGGWEDEVHIYVLHKNKVLNVVKNLLEMGAVKKKEKPIDKEDLSKGYKTVLSAQTKVKDEWGNFINVYKKNFGIVLSNKFIKSEYMDKFGLGLGEDSNFKNDYKIEEKNNIDFKLGKYLNEILIEWNDSDIKSNGIVKSSDVQEKLSNKKTFTANDIKFNMIRIPDTNWMIGETPVTMGLWKKVVSTEPKGHTTYSNPWDTALYREYDPLYPVCNVSYNDCVYFINELNSIFETSNFDIMPGWLWEKAFKEGGIKLPGEEPVDIADDHDEDYAGMLEKYGWFGGDDTGIKEVATKLPDNLGIYDMIGNVWEICSSDDFSPLFFGGSCETDFSMFMSRGSYPFVGFVAQSKYTREDDTGFRLAYKIQ